MLSPARPTRVVPHEAVDRPGSADYALADRRESAEQSTEYVPACPNDAECRVIWSALLELQSVDQLGQNLALQTVGRQAAM